jgi:hypothetical protein
MMKREILSLSSYTLKLLVENIIKNNLHLSNFLVAHNQLMHVSLMLFNDKKNLKEIELKNNINENFDSKSSLETLTEKLEASRSAKIS